MEHVHADEQLTKEQDIVSFFTGTLFFAVNRNQEATLTFDPHRPLNIAVHRPTDQQMLVSGPFFQRTRQHNNNKFKRDILHLHHIKNILPQAYNTTVISYTGCPRRNVPYFGRVFLMLKYTDINQNTYIQNSQIIKTKNARCNNKDNKDTYIQS
jgi:hypothetical protein